MRRGALVIALALTACGADTAPSIRGPADPSAAMRPDLIVSEPARAGPGDVVTLTFPQETTRGILFVLEERIGDRWEHRFNLTSNGPGPEWPMSWHLPDAEDVAFPDIGVAGPGPDRVTIPEVAEPGAWRICTGNAGDEICTAIEIVAP